VCVEQALSAVSLPGVCALARSNDFVAAAGSGGLCCGLAGSLLASGIPALVQLAPDLLGFRGALCRECKRTASLDREAVAGIRRAIPGCEEIGTERMITKMSERLHEEHAQ